MLINILPSDERRESKAQLLEHKAVTLPTAPQGYSTVSLLKAIKEHFQLATLSELLYGVCVITVIQMSNKSTGASDLT